MTNKTYCVAKFNKRTSEKLGRCLFSSLNELKAKEWVEEENAKLPQDQKEEVEFRVYSGDASHHISMGPTPRPREGFQS